MNLIATPRAIFLREVFATKQGNCNAIKVRQTGIKYNHIYPLYSPGIMLSSRNSPVSTPLEACRVAPYVNLPSSLRVSGAGPSQNLNTPPIASPGNAHFTGRPPPPPTGFPGFDPALLSVAAHQVSERHRLRKPLTDYSDYLSSSTRLPCPVLRCQ